MRVERLDPGDPRWDAFLADVPHDFYHLPGYADLVRGPHDTAAALFAEAGGAALLAPILLRPVPDATFRGVGYADAASPYGYPSPLVRGEPSPELLGAFLDGMAAWGRQNRVVSAFVRFHPLLPLPEGPFRQRGELVAHGETVCIDLTQDAEALDRQTRDCHRADARKLAGLGFRAAVDVWDQLPAFVQIYEETMTRRDAAQAFFFDRHYYQGLRACLGERLHLCMVHDPCGYPACGGLFTACYGIMQFHLSGTAAAFRRSGAAKLMLLHMRDWARERGLRWLHLGGGLGCAQDSLAFFKQGFSRGRARFSTFRMVFDPNVYRLLVRRAAPVQDPAFFPAYRHP